MKRQVLFLLVCFLAGVFSAQLFGTEFLVTYGFLNRHHITAFVHTEVPYLKVFWNVLWDRGKLFLLLAVLEMTPFQVALPKLIKEIVLYTFGLFFWACLMNMGFYGILVCMGSVMPQILPYAAALFLLFGLGGQPRYVGPGYTKSSLLRTPVIRYVSAVAAIVLLVVVGAVLEASVSRFLLKAVLGHLKAV